MDWLLIFGSVTVTVMLIMYALEDKSPRYVLGFAAACACSSLYGWISGTYPFGVIEAIWTIIALRRWRARITFAAIEVKS